MKRKTNTGGRQDDNKEGNDDHGESGGDEKQRDDRRPDRGESVVQRFVTGTPGYVASPSVILGTSTTGVSDTNQSSDMEKKKFFTFGKPRERKIMHDDGLAPAKMPSHSTSNLPGRKIAKLDASSSSNDSDGEVGVASPGVVWYGRDGHSRVEPPNEELDPDHSTIVVDSGEPDRNENNSNAQDDIVILEAYQPTPQQVQEEAWMRRRIRELELQKRELEERQEQQQVQQRQGQLEERKDAIIIINRNDIVHAEEVRIVPTSPGEEEEEEFSLPSPISDPPSVLYRAQTKNGGNDSDGESNLPIPPSTAVRTEVDGVYDEEESSIEMMSTPLPPPILPPIQTMIPPTTSILPITEDEGQQKPKSGGKDDGAAINGPIDANRNKIYVVALLCVLTAIVGGIVGLLLRSKNGDQHHTATSNSAVDLPTNPPTPWSYPSPVLSGPYPVQGTPSTQVVEPTGPRMISNGRISSDIGLFTSLTIIAFSREELHGPIPSEIGLLTRLTTLDLEYNELTGRIPSEIGLLTRLTSLDLGSNELTGPIPSEIGLLTRLKWLRLNSNSFGGSIPQPLFRLTNLVSLVLHHDDFQGTIPTEIGFLTSLTSLELEFNDIEGSIPREIGNLISLESLDVSYNDLTGTVPTSIGQLSDLSKLWVQVNAITGSIPTTLGWLTKLTYLNLHNNKFTSLPSQLGMLPKLTSLVADSNSLAGTIPSEMGAMTGLTDLKLHNNKLGGSIPPQLDQLHKIRDLWLHNNDLIGDMNTMFCDASTNYKEIDRVQFPDIDDLYSDCDTDDLEVTCDCCTACSPRT